MGKILAGAMALGLVAGSALAEDSTTEVQFPAGKTGTKVEGAVQGDDNTNFTLKVSEGQTLAVTMQSDNTANYFNIFAPGDQPGEDEAVFIGSVNGDSASLKLDETGTYTIQTYLMRNAARRDEVGNFTLDIAVDDAAAATAAKTATIVGTRPQARPETTATEKPQPKPEVTEASGKLPCSVRLGMPTRNCDFRVTREGDGKASLTIIWPDKGQREIKFEGGQPTAQEGMTTERRGDLTVINIGEERYEVPDAVVNGG